MTKIMRCPAKRDLCLAAAGAALWVAVFLLPAHPKAMPLSAFEAVADAAKPPRPARPVELPPLQRERENHSGADRQREFDCLAVNLFSRAQGEPSAARMTVASVTLDGLAHQRFPKRPCDVAGSRASPSSTGRRY
jgi:spore germination cell wall hydrolase CwlJ-like protein